MQIELWRIHTPEELGQQATCAICAGGFEMGVVDAVLITEENMLVGSVCPTCVEFQSHHPSGRFPTIEQYRWREGAWGTPLYASREEATRALGYPSA